MDPNCFYCVVSRREKEKKSRATVFITSGAMTFIVLAATLVTATFLFSPTIEEIFGEKCLGVKSEAINIYNGFWLSRTSEVFVINECI